METQMEVPEKKQHYPLPWHEGETASNKLAIFSQVSPVAIAELPTFPFHKNGPANAAFILRAVNNLDALIRIAQDALTFRELMNGRCGHDEYMAQLCTQCEIRAALATAKE